MEWRDQGIVLAVRRHGEHAAIVEVFTPTRGRHAGVVRGGASRKMTPILQPGSQIDVSWRARLEDHLGSFTVEPVRSRAAALSDRMALAGLNAVCALLSFALPERAAYPDLYHRTETLLDLLGNGDLWPLAYLRWEVALLDEMGFGMDLSACAVTGVNEPLDFVSPRTGRAVSAIGAGDWANRLLPLPDVLKGRGDAPDHEVAQAFRTTGHFLNAHLAAELGSKPLPDARQRYVDLFTRKTGQSG